MQIRIGAGILQRSKRRLGGQQLRPERLPHAIAVDHEAGRPLALQELDRAPAGFVSERLGLDLGFQREGRAEGAYASLLHETGLDLVALYQLCMGGRPPRAARRA
jgi:hypothetical protein